MTILAPLLTSPLRHHLPHSHQRTNRHLTDHQSRHPLQHQVCLPTTIPPQPLVLHRHLNPSTHLSAHSRPKPIDIRSTVLPGATPSLPDRHGALYHSGIRTSHRLVENRPQLNLLTQRNRRSLPLRNLLVPHLLPTLILLADLRLMQ